ncbi:hypothetical protein Thein_1028 [Thermodesulfatator indicus DSM 15286]|uniref:YprB ribonuclease H-like domain-containing protein n=1 Tax=Thermodesulfatator indicus (strain DSM 15286 / JCM 11887 / CIR29812) TaxID=667014 RepID=F8A8R6_THEID|nr:ribonuclease H-like domain-containing protein [Thermodesulfatator indicus]AEH44899.1 hypothetical protein Thein_1028 [Thermodesulfatator indicus DSM 15286]
MLYRTFLFLPGVSERTEFFLWQEGVTHWWKLLEAESLPGISPGRLSFWKKKLSQVIIFKENLASLAEILPKRHHWRLYQKFKNRALFLDIETDGLKKGLNQVTVLGLFDGEEYKAFIAGENLEEGLQILADAELVVTFGGSFFDFPFLRNHYPWLPMPKVHLDLCPLLKRLGFKGGLKRIEKVFGLARPSEIDGLDGFEAVRLWRKWQHQKDVKALEKLILYNREDVINLLYLAEITYQGLKHLVLTRHVPALTVSSEGVIRRPYELTEIRLKKMSNR